MATLKEIKSHIKSVSDTKKITNAMYLIATTKMKSAKSVYSIQVPYFNYLENEVKTITNYVKDNEYEKEKEGPIALLIVASDKGLCGDYNKSIIKKAEAFISENKDCKVFIIGEKAKKYFLSNNIPYENDFNFSIKNIEKSTIDDISNYFCENFIKGNFAKVIAIFSNIKSGVNEKQLLPILCDKSNNIEECAFFPSKEEVLDSIMPIYINNIFYNVIIHSFISEQSARMIAMDNANKNAKDMIAQLTLDYNHTRQNAITQEITEISAERKTK